MAIFVESSPCGAVVEVGLPVRSGEAKRANSAVSVRSVDAVGIVGLPNKSLY